MNKKFFVAVLVIGMIALPLSAAAQVEVGEYGTSFGLGTADLESTVISIVQWALGFLGLIAVIFILYGGFTWMTAGGNEDKISTAKKIITAAVIGLIVILLAWAIVTFVVGQANDLTT
ncbi:MAG: hypothetical protein WC505_05195 [Patescibacteria group bacterium]